MSMKISLLPDPTVTTSIVMIDETVSGTTTSVQYLNLGVDSSGKVRLLRCNASDARRMNNVNVAHYDGCEADVRLNNESTGYLSRFDSATRNALSSTSIKVKDENDGTIYEVARRCFLLSYTELGFDNTGAEGASILDVLKKWKNTTNANTARIATNDSGSAVYAWLRSPHSTTQFRLCFFDGSDYYGPATSGIYRLRPCLSFDPDTLVTDPDENGICYLLPDPDKPYREAEAEMLIGTPDVTPVEGILQVNAVGCMTDYPKAYFTTNYDGANTDDWYEVPIGRPFDIIGNGTDLGLKIYARTEGRCSISEPILSTGGEKDDN